MLPTARQVLDQAVHTGAVPGAALWVQADGQVEEDVALGVLGHHPPTPLPLRPVYDLASLTKPLVGASVAAALTADGPLDPEAEVRSILGRGPEGVTVHHLLTHTSGLPAWAPLYERLGGAVWGSADARAAILDAALSTPVQAAPGTRATYSDLGFLVLLAVLEQVGGARLDTLFTRHILRPAGVHGLTWGHPAAAPTERCPVRGRVVRGEVHDLNTSALGGVSTHAGLFGSAPAVGALATALTTPSGPLQAVVAVLSRWWSREAPGTHRGGWDTPSATGYTSTGHHFPADGVGHLGYTGTSLWVARARRTQVVLLTNRVHPTDDLTAIRALRPAVHDAVAHDLGWTEEAP